MYLLVFLLEDKVVVVWDFYGFWFLVMGMKSNGVYVFVLEMCVLDLIEVEYVCEVRRGGGGGGMWK